MVNSFLIRLITDPANNVSSRLKRSFHPAQPSTTFFFSFSKKSQTADMFGKEPEIIVSAFFSNAICNNLVPLVVVSTNVLPSINSLVYSNGELPCCNPSAIIPSLSPAAIPSMLFEISIALGTESTGITDLAPLYNAEAIVEVALKTSIITTTLLLKSYRCNKAGDKEVLRVGLSVI